MAADRISRLGERPNFHRDVGGGLAGVGRQYLAADLVVVPVARRAARGVVMAAVCGVVVMGGLESAELAVRIEEVTQGHEAGEAGEQ